MFKLVLEKAEEPQIKLPTSTGSWKKQESSRKTSISAVLTTPKPLTVWMTINCKILKEMGIPDRLTCLLRNLYAGQEATVRTGYETMDWFQIGKGEHQGYILSPCLFYLYAEYVIPNTGLEEAQAGIKIARRNISISIQPWHTPSPIWNQSVVSYPVLTVASWSAYRFLKRQVRWSGILTKCGPLVKGVANHLNILALRTPWTVWKGKMIGHWKRNSPGQ